MTDILLGEDGKVVEETKMSVEQLRELEARAESWVATRPEVAEPFDGCVLLGRLKDGSPGRWWFGHNATPSATDLLDQKGWRLYAGAIGWEAARFAVMESAAGCEVGEIRYARLHPDNKGYDTLAVWKRHPVAGE